MTEPTRAVTLDLWLTLISEPDGSNVSTDRRLLRADGALAVLAEHGEFFDRPRVIEVFDITSETISADHELGIDMYFGDRIVQTLSMLDEGLPERIGPAGVERLWEVIDASLDESPPSLMPGALEALRELSCKPVKLGVISNTGNSSSKAYGRMFKAMGIDDFFEVVSLSNELAMAKPSPAIFHHTLSTLGVEPGHALHVGDNPAADVAGASAVGMKTAWLVGPNRAGLAVQPDYFAMDISEIPAIVDAWLAAPATIGNARSTVPTGPDPVPPK